MTINDQGYHQVSLIAGDEYHDGSRVHFDSLAQNRPRVELSAGCVWLPPNTRSYRLSKVRWDEGSLGGLRSHKHWCTVLGGEVHGPEYARGSGLWQSPAIETGGRKESCLKGGAQTHAWDLSWHGSTKYFYHTVNSWPVLSLCASCRHFEILARDRAAAQWIWRPLVKWNGTSEQTHTHKKKHTFMLNGIHPLLFFLKVLCNRSRHWTEHEQIFHFGRAPECGWD